MPTRRADDDEDEDEDAPERPARFGRGAKVAVALSAMSVAAALVLLAVVLVRGRGPAEPDPNAGPSDPARPVDPAGPPGRTDEWTGGGATVAVGAAMANEADGSVYVFVSVSTADPRQRIDFRGWRGAVQGARDDAGNPYRPKAFDRFTDATFERVWNAQASSKKVKYGAGSVTSEQARVAGIALPKPPPAASYIDLDLDAWAIGQRGTIPLRIGRAVWADAR